MSVPVTELFAKLGIDVDESGLGHAVAAIGGLKTGLLAIGAVAGGLTVALAGMVKSTVDYGSKINDLAARTGTATTDLQKLGHVASLSGVGFEELAQAMNFAVRKNGVKDVGAEISKVADKIKALTEKGKGAEAAKLAMERFGRSGAALVPFLREGSEKIAQLAQEFDDLGLVLDESTIKATDELGDRIDVANASFRGLAYTIAKPLLEPLTKAVNVFIEWMKVNRKLIAARVHAALGLVARALKNLWQLAKPFVEIVKYLATNTWVLRAALIALAIVLASQVGNAIGGIVGQLPELYKGFKNLASSSTAIGLAWFALAAIVALVVEDIYQFLTGGESLTQRWGEKWVKLLDDLTEPHPTDPDWLTWLKVGLRVMGDLQSSWRYLKGEMSSDKFFQDVLGLQKGSKIESAAGTVMNVNRGLAQEMFGGVGRLFGGGAASPAAAAGVSSGGQRPGLVFSPSITTTVEASPMGVSADRFSKMIADENAKALERVFTEAAAGMGVP